MQLPPYRLKKKGSVYLRSWTLQNELSILELIHALVETLDRYFENVVRIIPTVTCLPYHTRLLTLPTPHPLLHTTSTPPPSLPPTTQPPPTTHTSSSPHHLLPSCSAPSTYSNPLTTQPANPTNHSSRPTFLRLPTTTLFYLPT